MRARTALGLLATFAFAVLSDQKLRARSRQASLSPASPEPVRRLLSKEDAARIAMAPEAVPHFVQRYWQ